ncbi:MAG: YggS family pyridoxal phosphate-dependent enzyme [Rhodocyclaceae bacterium]|nr:YggS family pyridoxal phosphate-dependent enzyme [Rhodocyclaceae bacterium]MCW5595693.1 YggS family pyridoxal phosphate-dependent enzyme [Rhodocyclaceae bacterium]
MTTISTNLQAVRARIAAAAEMAGRPPESIGLLAVSKTFPAEQVREAAGAGQLAFGENYVQEGLVKIAALEGLGLEWHFIGPLQSNKTRLVAEHFTWVHGVERLKIAERLSEARGAGRPPLQVCVQVNVSGEASKSGVSPGDTAALAQAVATLPNLRLRGLMAIPEPTDDMALARRRFSTLRQLRDTLNEAGLALDTLSMGMSHDLEAAILEGATLVRVGTAIFGERART